ncbi:MAG TPA: hypothetical protein VHK24_05090, partial [Steroidobacter sp.]|nr:hypothetical protein [Steroidobacter sp.]
LYKPQIEHQHGRRSSPIESRFAGVSSRRRHGPAPIARSSMNAASQAAHHDQPGGRLSRSWPQQAQLSRQYQCIRALSQSRQLRADEEIL